MKGSTNPAESKLINQLRYCFVMFYYLCEYGFHKNSAQNVASTNFLCDFQLFYFTFNIGIVIPKGGERHLRVMEKVCASKLVPFISSILVQHCSVETVNATKSVCVESKGR